LEIEKEMKELSTLDKEIKVSVKKEIAAKEKTKLSYKEQQDYDKLPDEIEALEEEISTINECLYNPDCYEEKGLVALSEKLSKLEVIYEEKTERYLEVLEIFESL
jgi:ATP-binding cassette subfamily F protein uup